MLEQIKGNDIEKTLKMSKYTVIMVRDGNQILDKVVESNLKRLSLKYENIGFYITDIDEFNLYLFKVKKSKINCGNVYIFKNNDIYRLPILMQPLKFIEYIS